MLRMPQVARARDTISPFSRPFTVAVNVVGWLVGCCRLHHIQQRCRRGLDSKYQKSCQLRSKVVLPFLLTSRFMKRVAARCLVSAPFGIPQAGCDQCIYTGCHGWIEAPKGMAVRCGRLVLHLNGCEMCMEASPGLSAGRSARRRRTTIPVRCQIGSKMGKFVTRFFTYLLLEAFLFSCGGNIQHLTPPRWRYFNKGNVQLLLGEGWWKKGGSDTAANEENCLTLWSYGKNIIERQKKKLKLFEIDIF